MKGLGGGGERGPRRGADELTVTRTVAVQSCALSRKTFAFLRRVLPFLLLPEVDGVCVHARVHVCARVCVRVLECACMCAAPVGTGSSFGRTR